MKSYPLVTYLWLRTEKSLEFRQSKGNNSCITDDTLMKPHVYSNTMIIYVQHKFQEILFIADLVMAEDGKISLKFRQSMGDNSSITHDTLMKLQVHHHNMFIYIQYKFHEIPSLGHLVMAEDGKIIEIQTIKGQ